MRSVNIPPFVLLKVQQDLIDVDHGRREEMMLLEDLKVQESIIKWKQESLVKLFLTPLRIYLIINPLVT